MDRNIKRSALAVALLIGINIAVLPSISNAATRVDLGAASTFGVLAQAGVTNVPAVGTVVSGTAGSSVGVSAGSAVTGFGVGTGVSGTIENNTAAAGTAITAAGNAFTAANSLTQLPVAHVLVPNETLTPGAYAIGTLATLSGTLTLNGGGNPNAVFVFTAPDSLTTASGSSINLIGNAQACNVFWAIGSSATLGTGSSFAGHLVAQASVTATSGTHVLGSLVALTGAVTLDNNLIQNDNCAAVVVPPVVPPVVTPVAPPVQSSTIGSVTPADCVTTGPTVVTLNGSFPTPITNITVGGKVIPASNWVQTATKIVVTAANPTNAPVVIQLYNGAVPLLAVQTFICAPAAVVPIVPIVPVVPTVTTATIHVIKVVNNLYGGSAVPGDFTLTLRHWGVDVAGSPAVGMASPGRAYIVAPGTYVVGELDAALYPRYVNSFDIAGQATNFINVKAGDDITVTQTNTEVSPVVAVVTPPISTPPTTTPGGTLPATGSPWFNLLLLGFGAMVVSGVVVGRKRSSKI